MNKTKQVKKAIEKHLTDRGFKNFQGMIITPQEWRGDDYGDKTRLIIHHEGQHCSSFFYPQDFYEDFEEMHGTIEEQGGVYMECINPAVSVIYDL